VSDEACHLHGIGQVVAPKIKEIHFEICAFFRSPDASGTNTLLVTESCKLGTNLPSPHGGRAYKKEI